MDILLKKKQAIQCRIFFIINDNRKSINYKQEKHLIEKFSISKYDFVILSQNTFMIKGSSTQRRNCASHHFTYNQKVESIIELSRQGNNYDKKEMINIDV